MIEDLVEHLQGGGIAIIRTDTLYGIVARAADEAAVEQVFSVKSRDRNKPLIVLLAAANQAYDDAAVVEQYSARADVPTTVIVDSPHAPSWLRHADGSVGYRVPLDKAVRDLLAQTGPLVAPSANPQGLPPATSIESARTYFKDEISTYVDGGIVPADQPPSRIVKRMTDGSIVRLR